MRPPGDTYPECVVRNRSVSPIDLDLARDQHSKFAEKLQQAGAKVKMLRPLSQFPDSVFIEDAAIVLDDRAIICSFAEPSRAGEEMELSRDLTGMAEMDFIVPPAHIDGGDCLIAEHSIFVGVSDRTNCEAVHQLREKLPKFKIHSVKVNPEKLLHLKTGASYVGRNTIVIAPHLVSPEHFEGFRLVEVPREESVAANCVYVGPNVFVPSGCPITNEKLAALDFNVNNVEISEFVKGDGSLTCLCLFV